jgi:hypothetical protein
MALINTALTRLQITFDTGLCQSEQIGKTIYWNEESCLTGCTKLLDLDNLVYRRSLLYLP